MPLESDVETLRKIPFFAGLPTARLKLIAYTAEVMEFAPGEMIIRQGDPADAVYILTEGEADVSIRDVDGHEIKLPTMGRHSLFGEVAVLSKGRRTTTIPLATASSPSRSPGTCFWTWSGRARRSACRS